MIVISNIYKQVTILDKSLISLQYIFMTVPQQRDSLLPYREIVYRTVLQKEIWLNKNKKILTKK